MNRCNILDATLEHHGVFCQLLEQNYRKSVQRNHLRDWGQVYNCNDALSGSVAPNDQISENYSRLLKFSVRWFFRIF